MNKLLLSAVIFLGLVSASFAMANPQCVPYTGATGDIHLGINKVYFGVADNSYLYYNGSAMVLNPGSSSNILSFGDQGQGIYKFKWNAAGTPMLWSYTGSNQNMRFGFGTYNFGGNVDATSYSVNGTQGFTGTGSYTTFEINNGIITNAY